MGDLKLKLHILEEQVLSARKKMNVDIDQKELTELISKSQETTFWDNSEYAQSVMKRISKLELKVGPWQKLAEEINEIRELSEMHDASMESEIEQQYSSAERDFQELKAQLKFSGPYDDDDAIIGIYAGAGGTDAQDWAAMLERMYLRWAEKVGVQAKIIQESSGEEAGIKSVTLEISGNFCYGKLKGEHGVHRLVRLSPFNADNLRQTSFAKVEVMPKIDQPDKIEIDEKDLKIDVFRSGGKGGQSVNTTDSAVRVTHVPTGITASIQNERSQIQNKETAMTILRSRLAQLQLEQHADKVSELKGPNQSAEWGNQIRSYVLHPYKQVKDLRSRYETSDIESVLDGKLDGLIEAYLEFSLGD